MLARIFVLLVVVHCFVSSEKAYDGYKVYDIDVKNEEELKILKDFEKSDGEERDLDFLSFHNNVDDDVRLMVKPTEQKFVEGVFKANNLNFKTVTTNVQE